MYAYIYTFTYAYTNAYTYTYTCMFRYAGERHSQKEVNESVGDPM